MSKKITIKCVGCLHCTEYDRYKTSRRDGNDCIEMVCEHPEVEAGKYNSKGWKRICTFRPYGSLRLGKNTQIKTKPRWCPLRVG